ncbi:MAG: superoxide dismutase [Erysipelotrichaceae bacterium]|nr:superoxide dismutase [Erysipelotrichaceae bacterium]
MYNQIELAYSFDALEPRIDALTMETHYTKHHAAYTKNLNDALTKIDLEAMPIEKLLSSLDEIKDESLRKTIRNNGGGFYNHNLYFDIIRPNNVTTVSGELALAISSQFNDIDELIKQLTTLALGQFGSGWAWLSTDKTGKLSVSATANQDNPLMFDPNLTPILGIDVWEHAYYLKYRNLRADYVKSFFEVVDWDVVNKHYLKALGK